MKKPLQIDIPVILILDPSENQQEQVFNYLQTLEQLSIFNINQPNLIWFNPNCESLKISDVREMINKTSFASYTSSPSTFVLLSADNASLPAQNALLKVLEEPPANSAIILAISRLEKIVSTIQSRCQIVNLLDKTGSLKTDLQERLPATFSEAITLAEKYKDKKAAIKLTSDLINFFTYQDQNQDKTGKVRKQLIQALNLLEKNVNSKLTLENCFFQILNEL